MGGGFDIYIVKATRDDLHKANGNIFLKHRQCFSFQSEVK